MLLLALCLLLSVRHLLHSYRTTSVSNTQHRFLCPQPQLDLTSLVLHHCCCFCCCRRSKKLTEYEKWEYKQLKMAGVLDVREYPLFDEEGGQGLLAGVDEVRVVCVQGG
jgi:hypothetical protein